MLTMITTSQYFEGAKNKCQIGLISMLMIIDIGWQLTPNYLVLGVEQILFFHNSTKKLATQWKYVVHM